MSNDISTSIAVSPENTPEPVRDVGKMQWADFPYRLFPDLAGKRLSRFQVLIKQSVLNEIYKHGESVDRIEVCGVMIGNLYRDDVGPYLYIEASARGDNAASQAAQVTFTAQTWLGIQTIMDKDYPTSSIVGWYHTHPSFGIFLSDMDVFIHENFFSLPWQVAYVYDPITPDEGLFVWRDGKPVREPILVEADAPRPSKRMVARPTDAAVAGATPVVMTDLLDRIHSMEQVQRWMLAGLLLLGVVTLAWPLAMFALVSGRQDMQYSPSSSSTATPPPMSGTVARPTSTTQPALTLPGAISDKASTEPANVLPESEPSPVSTQPGT